MEDGKYQYLLSGSLLGVELKDIRSFPVGYMDVYGVSTGFLKRFSWAKWCFQANFLKCCGNVIRENYRRAKSYMKNDGVVSDYVFDGRGACQGQ